MKGEGGMLEQYLATVAKELNGLGKRELFKQEWLTNGKWNQYSWLHARMLGILVRSVKTPLFPMVEARWDGNFKPDIQVVNEDDDTIAVIEYESTNSSDQRLMIKDIDHFEKAILEYADYEKHPDDSDWKLPEWWILISTLPNCAVVRWPWWQDYSENPRYPPQVKSRMERDQNPLNYYRPALHQYLAESWQKIVKEFGKTPPCKLVWVNLSTDSIGVMNVNGQPTEGPRFTLKLSD